MFFALAFRFAECALRFKNRNRFAGDFGRVRGASDGSGGGQGKGVDWRAHGAIRAQEVAIWKGNVARAGKPLRLTVEAMQVPRRMALGVREQRPALRIASRRRQKSAPFLFGRSASDLETDQ